jgi:hypothetical protein
VDHEDGSMRVVASCYERFLWFHLDKLQREFEPDGTDRNIYGFWVEEGEDEDEEPEEPYVPWPYQDAAWMLKHDPPLAKWITPIAD